PSVHYPPALRILLSSPTLAAFLLPLTPPPPLSTLFPYTTLFRSDFENYPYYHHVDDEISEMDFSHMAKVINISLPVLEQMTNAKDRKSTRLNSSHVKISYAVFCLKKKTMICTDAGSGSATPFPIW